MADGGRQFRLDIVDELIVDLFAGGGGTSVAIEQAFGRHADIAVNHNDNALSMHHANSILPKASLMITSSNGGMTDAHLANLIRFAWSATVSVRRRQPRCCARTTRASG